MRIGVVLLVAVIAGLLGLVASLMLGGPGPLLQTEIGQRALQGAMDASAAPPPAGTEIAKRGQIVPQVSLVDLDGNTVQLPELYPGRPLLVNFWASWCAPCVEEMPELQRYFARQEHTGVQVIGIALDDNDAVRRFLERVAVRYPVFLDSPGPADSSVRWGNRKGVLPYTILIDAHGRMRQQRIGPFAEGQIGEWVDAGLQQN